MKLKTIILSGLLLCLGGAWLTHAKVFMNMEEALVQAFPRATVKKETVFLTDAQATAIDKRGNEKLERNIVYVYRAYREDKLVGTAYFDKHRVRTLPETLMLVIAPDHTVQQIRVLAFNEPREYLPREKWYAQFTGKTLTPELRMGREIDGVTGATLTARATTHAVRRVLAIHEVLHGAVAAP